MCTCQTGWAGVSCQNAATCPANTFGANCQPCPSCSGHGTCNAGVTGNGSCTCSGGYSDPNCSTPPAPACTLKTCSQLAAQCGSPDDGCGTNLSCGTCAAGQACNASNQCE